MKISDLNPHIRYAKIHKAIFSNENRPSKCYDCRIFFFNNSVGSAIINGIEYNISKNTAIYLPPKSEYKFHINFKDDVQIIVINFDLVNDYNHIKNSLHTGTKDTFDEKLVPKYSILDELSHPIIKTITNIEKKLTTCTENFLTKDSFYREHSSALLKICLLEFIKQSSQISHSKLCADILSYIHGNYSNSSLTNKSIAEKFYHHPYHLNRLIKSETGKTLHQYIIYYRLQIAKNYLLTTQYDISKISWLCGFCSTAYFIKTFHQNIGITPKKYRSLNLNTEI